MNEVRLSQRLGATGFPSLILKSGDEFQNMQIDYNDAEKMLTRIVHE